MQADLLESAPPKLRRGTRAATQRAATALRGMGFLPRVEMVEWDDAPVCLIVLEGFDDVAIQAHCSEDEPDGAWRVVANVPGMDLADVELRNLTRTSDSPAVARAIVPYLSMTREELARL